VLLTLLDRQVVFFGGKGGVGKTTTSSAFALAASRRGRRVLLVSTDPAHSISDIFERRIGGREQELAPRLSAIEIDATTESQRYVAGVKREIERMFSPAVIRQAHRQIDMAAASPGLAEVALLDRMIDLIIDREASYDLIVFDTAPTGHTLQLLRMPDAMTTWIQALLRHRRALLEIDAGSPEAAHVQAADDPVLVSLERRHGRLMALHDRVVDRGRTSFVLVTIPERLAVEETARAFGLLQETGLDVGALIINRILPEGLEGEFYRSRKMQEGTYLEEIRRRFPRVHRVEVRQLPRDVYGVEPLGLVAGQLLPAGRLEGRQENRA
jgi:arsenite-transporting ATPase